MPNCYATFSIIRKHTHISSYADIIMKIAIKIKNPPIRLSQS